MESFQEWRLSSSLVLGNRSSWQGGGLDRGLNSICRNRPWETFPELNSCWSRSLRSASQETPQLLSADTPREESSLAATQQSSIVLIPDYTQFKCCFLTWTHESMVLTEPAECVCVCERDSWLVWLCRDIWETLRCAAMIAGWCRYLNANVCVLHLSHTHTPQLRKTIFYFKFFRALFKCHVDIF